MRVADWVTSGVSPSQLRHRVWRHPFHGVVSMAGADEAHPQTRIQDAAALLGHDGALGGWAARWWQGVAYCDGYDGNERPLPVLLHTSERFRRRRRLLVEPTRCVLHPDELTELGDVRVTTLARAAYDDARLARTLTDAVIVLDMSTSRVARGARTTLGQIGRVVASHRKTRGIRQVRQALELATEHSASPLESRTRMFAVLRLGLTGWLVNVPVFDRIGRVLGIADLLDPETGLVLESDGGAHLTAERRARDGVRDQGSARRT